MKLSLLDVLRCPATGKPLQLSASHIEGDEIIAGILHCPGFMYEIYRGVPRMVESQRYSANFGFEWIVHRTTQIDNERSSESRQAFLEKTGWSEPELAGKRVLDVGTGSGRFADIALRADAEVYGVDISRAVESAYNNLGSNPRFHVIQADVFHLPFGPETFDYIFSLGVLHHTPDTQRAFSQLPRLLKPGGKIAIWVYPINLPHDKATFFWRQFTTKIPPALLYPLTSAMSRALHFRTAPGMEMNLKKSLPWWLYDYLPPVSAHDNPMWRVLDTFDWYSPVFQHRHSYPEVTRWFQDAGLTDIMELPIPISVSGRKPENVA